MKWLVRLNLKEFWRGLTFRYGIVYLLLWLGGRTRTKPPEFNWSVFTGGGVNESATEIVFFNSNFSKPFQQVQPIFKPLRRKISKWKHEFLYGVLVLISNIQIMGMQRSQDLWPVLDGKLVCLKLCMSFLDNAKNDASILDEAIKWHFSVFRIFI